MAQLSRKLRAFSFEAGRRWKSRGASNVSLRTKSREFAMQMLFPMGHEPAGFHQAGSEILEKREGRGHDARFREQTF